MNRYLVITDEIILSEKSSISTHFDIIPANNAEEALERVKSKRPRVKRYVILSMKEVVSIQSAMIMKTDEELIARFERNFK